MVGTLPTVMNVDRLFLKLNRLICNIGMMWKENLPLWIVVEDEVNTSIAEIAHSWPHTCRLRLSK